MPRNDKIDVDLSVLADYSDEQTGKIPLKRAMASGKFAQVGINLFRHQENNTIWQLQAGDDGEFIIRAEPVEEQHTVESSQDGEWTAICDSSKQNITLSHHKLPLCRFASKDFGFDAETAEQFQKYLIEQLESEGFRDSVQAYATGACPCCHAEVHEVGLQKVSCTNAKCKYGSDWGSKHQFLSKKVDTVALPSFSGPGMGESMPVYNNKGDLLGNLGMEKARELEDKGLIRVEQTPQGARAIRVKEPV